MTVRNGVNSSRCILDRSLENLAVFRNRLMGGQSIELAYRDFANLGMPGAQNPEIIEMVSLLRASKETPLLELQEGSAQALLHFLNLAERLHQMRGGFFFGTLATSGVSKDSWKDLIDRGFFK